MIDKNYLAQLENKNLKKLLLRKENIPLLEDLINEEAQRRKHLQKKEKKGELDPGKKVPKKELKNLFDKVKKDVDTFLDVKDINCPSHGYFSIFKPSNLLSIPLIGLYSVGGAFLVSGIMPPLDFGYLAGGVCAIAQAKILHWILGVWTQYNPLTKTINLAKEKKIILTATIAHEYTHYVQQKNGFSMIIPGKQGIFKEGHARGVERHISNLYREREDNEAFLYDIVDQTLGDLKSTYIWMCKKFKITPQKSLLKNKSLQEADKIDRIIFGLSAHALGNALFSIYEAEYGPQVYRDAIHGEFDFNKKIKIEQKK